MSAHSPLRLVLLLALTLPAMPVVASAQQAQPSVQTKRAAHDLADSGLEHFNAGRYEEALAAFRDAEALVHAPPFLFWSARSCEELGRLLEARALYQRVVDEPLAADAPGVFQKAQADARTRLAALAPRIPTLEVAITGAAPGAAALTLDGEPISQATPVERDPGEYTLVAVAPGGSPIKKTIRLNEGAKEHVTIVLATPPAASPPGRDAPTASASNMRMGVIVGGVAVAGTGLIAGLAFTLAANGKASAKQEQYARVDAIAGPDLDCRSPTPGDPAQQCEELRSLVADRDLFSNLAVWSFVAGGAAALGTLGYYLLAGPSSTPEQKHVRIVPFVTPGAGGVVAGGVF